MTNLQQAISRHFHTHLDLGNVIISSMGPRKARVQIFDSVWVVTSTGRARLICGDDTARDTEGESR